MSKVVLIRIKSARPGKDDWSPEILLEMFSRGFALLGEPEPAADILRELFSNSMGIGIKINTIGGKNLSTTPRTSMALVEILARSGLDAGRILIWDRTVRELKDAGYPINTTRSGVKIFATDSSGNGYEPELTVHRNIGSRFSTIMTKSIQASISLAILKDHGLAGITAGMKNYFGAIHNPNKYHDSNCNPYVAEVFESPQVRRKHRITILDALRIQYHRGPAYHPKWIEPYGALIFSTDPVAADAVGWKLIENIRAEKGLPSLAEENRQPDYIRTAHEMGLGTADISEIDLKEFVINGN